MARTTGRSARKRKMTSKQKADARASARKHGRSRPGLWENVNASKGRGTKAGRKAGGRKAKGRTRPGKRSRRPRRR